MEWYMEKDGGPAGPFSDTTIRELAAQGLLAPATRVWCTGMDNWKRADEVAGLLLPPALPTEPLAGQPVTPGAIESSSARLEASSAGTEEYRVAVLARPWPRYWARMLDLVVGASVAGLLIGWTAPQMFEAEMFAGPGGELWLNMAFVPIALLVDAILGALFGNTPGKWVAGLRVRTLRNEKPTIGILMGRNARMYVSGLALGLPLISLFTVVRSFQLVKANELVSWDRVSSTRVYDVNSSVARTWTTAILVFLVYVALSALGMASVAP